jgi:hypothetical protein
MKIAGRKDSRGLNSLPAQLLESVCGEISAFSAYWRFAVLGYEDAYQREDVRPRLKSLVILAQNATGEHTS